MKTRGANLRTRMRNYPLAIVRDRRGYTRKVVAVRNLDYWPKLICSGVGAEQKRNEMFTIVISEDRDLRDSMAAAHASRHNDVLESNRGLIHLSQKMRKERRALASSVRFLTGRRAATRGKPGRLKVFDRKQNNRASGGAAGQSPFADNLYRRDIRELNSEVLSAQLVAGGTQGDVALHVFGPFRLARVVASCTVAAAIKTCPTPPTISTSSLPTSFRETFG
jgi:hypothetical protein